MPRHARRGRARSTAAAQRLPARPCPGEPLRPGSCSRDHRRRRHRHRAGGRAAPHGARWCLRARQDRPREGHQDHPDRGRRPDPARAARAPSEATVRLLQRLGSTCARAGTEVRGRRRAAGDGASPGRAGGLGRRREAHDCWDIDGLETNRANQLVVTATLQTTRDETSSRSATAHLLLPEADRPVPPRAQAAHQQARPWQADPAAAERRAAAALRLPRLRLAGLAGRVQHGRQPDGLHGRQELMIEGYLARLMYRRSTRCTSWRCMARSRCSWALARPSRRTEPHVKLQIRGVAGHEAGAPLARREGQP